MTFRKLRKLELVLEFCGKICAAYRKTLTVEREFGPLLKEAEQDPFPEDAPIPAVPKATLLNIPDLNPLLATFLGAMEEILGRENRYLATVLNGLGGLYEAVGRYAKAKPLYERALGIYEKSLGPEHPNVARPLRESIDCAAPTQLQTHIRKMSEQIDSFGFCQFTF
jgi:tetratricopeptide (TPR) repeat protein